MKASSIKVMEGGKGGREVREEHPWKALRQIEVKDRGTRGREVKEEQPSNA